MCLKMARRGRPSLRESLERSTPAGYAGQRTLTAMFSANPIESLVNNLYAEQRRTEALLQSMMHPGPDRTTIPTAPPVPAVEAPDSQKTLDAPMVVDHEDEQDVATTQPDVDIPVVEPASHFPIDESRREVVHVPVPSIPLPRELQAIMHRTLSPPLRMDGVPVETQPTRRGVEVPENRIRAPDRPRYGAHHPSISSHRAGDVDRRALVHVHEH